MPAKYHSAGMKRIANELGFINIYWSWLEDAIDAFIAKLAPIRKADAANAILGNADIRQKAQMVKAIAFMRKGQHQDWYDSVVETINDIDNNLRSRRNTFIHSSWYEPDGQVTRHKKIIRLAKSQSFQPVTLTTIDKKPVKIVELRKLSKDILYAVRMTVTQLAYASDFPQYAYREISFPQFVRLAKFVGRQRDKRIARKRRRKS
jgi:hypothetical protein